MPWGYIAGVSRSHNPTNKFARQFPDVRPNLPDSTKSFPMLDVTLRFKERSHRIFQLLRSRFLFKLIKHQGYLTDCLNCRCHN
jgi:hypothetical protein